MKTRLLAIFFLLLGVAGDVRRYGVGDGLYSIYTFIGGIYIV